MSTPTIELLERTSATLVVARYVDRQRMIWGIEAVPWRLCRLRKESRCPITDRRLEPGDLAWRPLGNMQWSYVRIAREVLAER